MPDTIDSILKQLPAIRRAAEDFREVLLANLVMFGEIPSPTFREEQRIEFLQQRFSEFGLQNCATDEVGNGLGLLPGQDGSSNILVVAHADTVFADTVDHTISLQTGQASGAGVSDNSLGLAVLASLPLLLEKLKIRLRSNLVLMADVKSLGRGNLEGIRFFLNNNALPFRAGVCIEGVHLGRVSYGSIGMVRGEISCEVPTEYDWTRFGTTNAILSINDIINRLVEIALPRRPRASIVMGSVHGGTSFNTIATNARLRLEIRSEAADMVARLEEEVDSIISEVASRDDCLVRFDVVARRDPGGLGFSHPLVRHTRHILRALDIRDRVAPSLSELSAFIDCGIPALTLGLTTGERFNELTETVDIDPIFTGVAQLVGTLLAIDGGLCDED